MTGGGGDGGGVMATFFVQLAPINVISAMNKV
jgi:hypothetical protein